MKVGPKTNAVDEICPMCGRRKSRHTKQQMKACSSKKLEFAKNKKGGAGIR